MRRLLSAVTPLLMQNAKQECYLAQMNSAYIYSPLLIIFLGHLTDLSISSRFPSRTIQYRTILVATYSSSQSRFRLTDGAVGAPGSLAI